MSAALSYRHVERSIRLFLNKHGVDDVEILADWDEVRLYLPETDSEKASLLVDPNSKMISFRDRHNQRIGAPVYYKNQLENMLQQCIPLYRKSRHWTARTNQ